MPTTTPWFILTRFDGDGDQADGDTPPADTPEPTDQPAPPGDTPAGKDWQAEAEKWRALARRHEDRAKANADKAKRLDQLEESQKSEAEKLAAAREAAEQRAAQALARAVKAEVKALAADDFADPSDAESAIDAAVYVNDVGDIDTDGIKSRLAELLEAKPHWRKQQAGPSRPKPDPGQGPRGDTTPVDYRTADRDTFATKLSEYGLRPRS